MKFELPSARSLAVISGVVAVVSFLIMILLLHFGHSEVSTAQEAAAPSGGYATAPALGILSSLAAFVFGLIGLACAVACFVFLRKRNKE